MSCVHFPRRISRKDTSHRHAHVKSAVSAVEALKEIVARLDPELVVKLQLPQDKKTCKMLGAYALALEELPVCWNQI
jgi:hypothetical protein